MYVPEDKGTEYFYLCWANVIYDECIISGLYVTSYNAYVFYHIIGEDRWLCTLLLQAGHRVEYSAASDAYTYAPEEFKEFYNQRRRWITSTFANIMDLLEWVGF